MGDKASIEWAANADGTPGATWNPIRARDTVTGRTGTFCVHASEGCRNCYAETMQARKLPNNGIGLAYTAPNLKRVEHYLDERMLAIPLKRRKPTTYFLSSMTDVFGEWVPDAMLDQLFATIARAHCQRHTFIIVTKRAERMRAYMTGLQSRNIVAGEDGSPDRIEVVRVVWPLPNVWLVVSVEDQANADARIPHLLATPAAVRGLSCEPALASVDLTRLTVSTGHAASAPGAFNALAGTLIVGAVDGIGGIAYETPRLDWVICGGESGSKARPMHPDWVRSLRDQCAAAGVPFFFKQWGELKPCPFEGPHAGCHHIWPDGSAMLKVGKRRAGRLLDGQEHNARPPIGGRDG